jgi:hypothetical protein
MMLAIDESFEDFYSEHATVLTKAAASQFNIPPDVAEQLVHEILVASVIQQPRIMDPAAWFMGALTKAAQRNTNA